jgi:C_GCAxxG_C_C family probable redox protein
MASSRKTRGRLRMSIEEEARRFFDSGFNCAESVLLAVSKQAGLEKQGVESFIPRIATGFGGGIARNGDTCGALSGGIMVISLALGRNKSDESRDPCYPAVDQFYNDFVKAFGTCKCRELTGVNFKTPVGSEAYRNRIHRERCTPLVEWAAKAASNVIKEIRSK